MHILACTYDPPAARMDGKQVLQHGSTCLLSCMYLDQGRCAVAILQGCMAVFPAMEMDALDEIIGGQPHRTSVATTVGNCHMQKLSKLGIGEVGMPLEDISCSCTCT